MAHDGVFSRDAHAAVYLPCFAGDVDGDSARPEEVSEREGQHLLVWRASSGS